MLFGSRNYTQSVDIWSLACLIADIYNGYPLFPGNTEIDQIARFGEILGSCSEENWKGIKELPDYGKISFSYNPP